jgi:hypothetical protein
LAKIQSLRVLANSTVYASNAGEWSGLLHADSDPLSPMLLTVLAVLTVFSVVARIRIILFPALPFTTERNVDASPQERLRASRQPACRLAP